MIFLNLNKVLFLIYVPTILITRMLSRSNLYELITFYYRPQRSCVQGNVFTAVCDSVHGGGGGIDPPGQGEPPLAGRPPRHTVNERPVRILLECILVYLVFPS